MAAVPKFPGPRTANSKAAYQGGVKPMLGELRSVLRGHQEAIGICLLTPRPGPEFVPNDYMNRERLLKDGFKMRPFSWLLLHAAGQQIVHDAGHRAGGKHRNDPD